MSLKSFNSFLYFLEKNNYACPNPDKWNKVYDIIGRPKSTGIPLILNGWWGSTTLQKKERFIKHIEYANKKNKSILFRTLIYLDSLNKEDWLSIDETTG